MKHLLTEARKFTVVVAGLVAQAIAAGLLTGSAAHYAQVALGIATAIGVYVVPNITAAQ